MRKNEKGDIVSITCFSIVMLCVLGIFFCIYLSFRNDRVYNKRVGIINKISIMNSIDIDKGKRDYNWRYEALNLYSYNRMFWQLFKFDWSWKEICDNYKKELNEIQNERISQ